MRQLLRTLFTLVATLFVCFAAEHALTLRLASCNGSSVAEFAASVSHKSGSNAHDLSDLHECQAPADALTTAETLTRIASTRPARIIPAQSGGKRSASAANPLCGKRLKETFGSATLRNVARTTINFNGAHIDHYVIALRHILR